MINILYTGDKKTFRQMLISLISLKNTTKEPLNIINLTEYIPSYCPHSKKSTPEQDAFCDKLLKSVNPQSSFKSIDVSDLVMKYLTVGKNTVNKWYPYPAFVSVRLLMGLVKEIPDKVLYLDTDTILINDVKELWDIDISNYDYAGRRDLWRITNYLQSGVMLMNVKRMRENGVFDRALYNVQNKKIMAYIDMTALNTATKDKLRLPKRFNTYRYRKDGVVHHVCSLRESWFFPFLTKKWLHRIKPDELPLARQRMPYHENTYKEFEAIEKEHMELF